MADAAVSVPKRSKSVSISVPEGDQENYGTTGAAVLHGSRGVAKRITTDALLKCFGPEALKRRTEYMGMSVEALLEECNQRGVELEKVDTTDHTSLMNALESHDLVYKDCWVSSGSFDAFFLVVCCAQALLIGVHIESPELWTLETWWQIIGLFFLVFLMEAILKTYSLGWRTYIHDHWHKFDVFILCVTATQFFSDDLRKFSWYPRVSPDVPQVIRLLRVLRLAKFIKQVGVLISSFLGSIKALVWIVFLLFLWFYIAACYTTIFIGQRPVAEGEDPEKVKEVKELFSSIAISMFTLFEVMTLEGWPSYVGPFKATRLHIVVFFVVHIFITAFFMLNLVTAVIVDRTVAAQREQDDNVNKVQETHRTARLHYIIAMLRRNADSRKSKVVHRADLLREELGEDAVRHMEAMGWSDDYVRQMFDLADFDCNGKVKIDLFEKMLSAGHQPLNTDNFVRFQMNMARRLDFQESLVISALGALEVLCEGKHEIPEPVKQRIRAAKAEDVGSTSIGFHRGRVSTGGVGL
eukprot:TRINITY_DN15185_c0_g1_i1.p1 TRINITY_DN15185_c0_g1~~TRINITY_DN15185_c0_g1_i1.p1  ORF type:complete len:539 (-),score=85.87 TRINITY_DN15185_c0_g1_i1:130-1701(-)